METTYKTILEVYKDSELYSRYEMLNTRPIDVFGDEITGQPCFKLNGSIVYVNQEFTRNHSIEDDRKNFPHQIHMVPKPLSSYGDLYLEVLDNMNINIYRRVK